MRAVFGQWDAQGKSKNCEGEFEGGIGSSSPYFRKGVQLKTGQVCAGIIGENER